MEEQKEKHKDPFKGLAFQGKPVSKEEYVNAYESYVKRCCSGAS